MNAGKLENGDDDCNKLWNKNHVERHSANERSRIRSSTNMFLLDRAMRLQGHYHRENQDHKSPLGYIMGKGSESLGVLCAIIGARGDSGVHFLKTVRYAEAWMCQNASWCVCLGKKCCRVE